MHLTMNENLKEIVNGKLLPQHNGKKVIIVGKVTQINPNGLSFEMKSVDDVMVKVNLKRPQRDLQEDYVEVHGMSQGQSVICDEIIEFPKDTTSKFDPSAHNVLCNLLQSVPDLWKTKNL